MNPLFLIFNACTMDSDLTEVETWGEAPMANDTIAQACLPPEMSPPEDLTTGEAVAGWVDQDTIMMLWETVLNGSVLEFSAKENIEGDGEVVRLDFSAYADRAGENADFIDGRTGVSGVVSDFEKYVPYFYDNSTAYEGDVLYDEFLVTEGNQSSFLSSEAQDVTWDSFYFENTERLSVNYAEAHAPLTTICASTAGEFSPTGAGSPRLYEGVEYYIGYRPDELRYASIGLDIGVMVSYFCHMDTETSDVTCQQEVFAGGAKIEDDGNDEDLFIRTTSSGGGATRLIGDIRDETSRISGLTSSVSTENYSFTEGDTMLSGGFYNPQ